jgi:hypothetical protein
VASQTALPPDCPPTAVYQGLRVPARSTSATFLITPKTAYFGPPSSVSIPSPPSMVYRGVVGDRAILLYHNMLGLWHVLLQHGAYLLIHCAAKHRLVVEAKNSVSYRYGYLRRREPVVQPAT